MRTITLLLFVSFLLPPNQAVAQQIDIARLDKLSGDLIRQCQSEVNAVIAFRGGEHPGASISQAKEYASAFLHSELKNNGHMEMRKILQGSLSEAEYHNKLNQNTYDRAKNLRALCFTRSLLGLNTPVHSKQTDTAGAASPTSVQSLTESAATHKRVAPKITTIASIGNGCVKASARNHRLNEIDKDAHSIDLVLTNSCINPQVVKVDVSGFGQLGWPAVFNLGQWASTANADVPPGIPFKPIISMAEGGSYMISEKGEYSGTWQIPKSAGFDNELKVWVASCDAYSPSGMLQVIFRPAPHFAQDGRAYCGPSRLKN